MQWKIISPVLEIQFGDDRESSTSEYKETKSQWTELEVGGVHSTVRGEGQHNLFRGKGPCFVNATEEWRIWGLP